METEDKKREMQSGAGGDADGERAEGLRGENSEADGGLTIERVMSEIDGMVGGRDFKRLARELIEVAPMIHVTGNYGVFATQSYLFSIGEGCGSTSYLNLLAALISVLGLRGVNSIAAVSEVALGPYSNGTEAFNNALMQLAETDGSVVKLMCIDISEWLDKTDSAEFKQFLRVLERLNPYYIFVFKIPFVAKDVLERIKFSLNDLLVVRSVSFPPLGRNDVKNYAEREIAKYRFKVGKDAWDYFFDRISEEKSDGKFYGLATVKKVINELLYNKMLAESGKKRPSLVISRKDMSALCGVVEKSELSGWEQLDRLVGAEEIKSKIKEIVEKTERANQLAAEDRPCIHVRFVGNSGTGKTTVARILAKILKEKGLLRDGNFFEYVGRDLCGKYIGETAPKTLSICRDAYGSVLFIDEAYSVFRSDDDRDFGREAIQTLVGEMKNHRTDFMVILADYADNMDRLTGVSEDLKKCLTYTLNFPDFTREQLYEIYAAAVKEKFAYDDKILPAAREYFEGLSREFITSKEFSNARFVHNLLERTWAKAALRGELDNSDIVLTKDDFDCASKEKDLSFDIPKKTKMGFTFR